MGTVQSTRRLQIPPAVALASGARSSLRDAGLIIPTYNAARHWTALEAALKQQGLRDDQVLIIDSSSMDGTPMLARRAGYRLIQIAQTEFRHGATRQAACQYLPLAERLVFLTQDAIPATARSLATLCRALDDPAVGAAYGRQIARPQADPLERHGRLYNYPEVPEVRSFESRHQMGFRAAYFSNSFAVYRRSALDAVGGFPTDTIVSEEVTVAARMLMAGWKLAYQADAAAIHSHPLTLGSEFRRYFDIGVHHGREPWLLQTFGTVGNEGRQFVLDELRFLWSNAPLWMPYAALRTIGKYLGYQLGAHERLLPHALKPKLSAHPQFWSA